MVPARLNVVTLGARDLPRLRDFYASLGWEVAIEAEDFCAFRLGGIFLGLFPSDKLAADGHAEAAAVTKPPGDPVEFEGRNAYFADPEDNYWEVVYLKSGIPG